jgi:hypothetical protein
MESLLTHNAHWASKFKASSRNLKFLAEEDKRKRKERRRRACECLTRCNAESSISSMETSERNLATAMHRAVTVLADFATRQDLEKAICLC